MKKWNTPVVEVLELAETEHEFRFQFSKDGGYLGDGKISGWFGKKTTTVTPEPTPAAPVIPEVEDVVDFVS